MHDTLRPLIIDPPADCPRDRQRQIRTNGITAGRHELRRPPAADLLRNLLRRAATATRDDRVRRWLESMAAGESGNSEAATREMGSSVRRRRKKNE
jgi:hypothetical protein